MLKMKRIYEIPDTEDGFRILVDRVWPRGMTKEKASLDYWAKEITPSISLRKFFSHKAENFEAFTSGYVDELNSNAEGPSFLNIIKDRLKSGNVTLVYAAKDEKINHVVILKDWIERNINLSNI